MLPSHVSSTAYDETMNRHGYGGANGQAAGGGAYPLSPTFLEQTPTSRSFNIRPDKYEK